MPKIGVLGPWVANYHAINGVVSYSDGIKLARQTQFEATPDNADNDNDFYSDNGISETARGTSKSGTINESVDHFSQQGSQYILGVREEEITVGGKPYKELVYDERTKPGYLGHGIIITKRKNGKDVHRAVVHTKVMFAIPPDAAKTKGANIEWQAEELTATYMADDSGTGRWKREATFDTEAEAVAYIETVLHIETIGELTVASAAGTQTGCTAVTVVPPLITGSAYQYAVAPEVGLPTFGAPIGEGYTAWDGTAEILADTGLKILVVEVDEQSLARKAGIATVASSD